MQFFKYLYQIVKAPQVDACLRFVKDCERRVAGNDSGYLDTLELAAGEAER